MFTGLGAQWDKNASLNRQQSAVDGQLRAGSRATIPNPLNPHGGSGYGNAGQAQAEIKEFGRDVRNNIIVELTGVGIGAAANYGRFQKARKAYAVVPQVSDSKLKNIVRDLFKGAYTPNPIGTGMTGDALRNEIKTGQATYGVFHIDKAKQYVNALTNWLTKHPNASHSDKLVAQSLLDDLKDALGTQ